MTVRVTGHATLKQRKRGPVWYLKYRLADGRQVQKLLGPAWAERGRPPAGYFTRKTADEALQELLADARRGTLADSGSVASFSSAISVVSVEFKIKAFQRALDHGARTPLRRSARPAPQYHSTRLACAGSNPRPA